MQNCGALLNLWLLVEEETPSWAAANEDLLPGNERSKTPSISATGNCTGGGGEAQTIGVCGQLDVTLCDSGSLIDGAAVAPLTQMFFAWQPFCGTQLGAGYRCWIGSGTLLQ